MTTKASGLLASRGRARAIELRAARRAMGRYQIPGGTLTATSVITDADRTAARAWTASQQGGQTDGQTPPSGFFIGRAATNLFRRGQDDANTDTVAEGSGVTIGAPDVGTPFPFSPQSIPVTCDGAAANQGAYIRTNSGQAAAAAVNGVGSTRFKGVAGQAYKCLLRWRNTDASVTSGTAVSFTASGAVQLLGDAIGGVATLAALAVAAGKTGDRLELVVYIDGTRAETFYLGHGMLEKGQSVVAPYVTTSGGATATHAAARVQAPATLLNATQGWIAMRVRMGYASTDVAGIVSAASGVAIGLFTWQLDGNNRILGTIPNSAAVSANRTAAGVGGSANSAAQTWATGDMMSFVFAWDANFVYVSVNGGAFVKTANTSIPVGLPATFDIGTRAGGVPQINGDVLWFACGTGTLTDTDAAAINAFGSTVPAPWSFSRSALTTAVMPMLTTSYNLG